ncbi:UvrD-helicase domain-containing protein [Mesorhizobium sp. ORM6]
MEIVKDALANPGQRTAILTYTENNITGIRQGIVEHNAVPAEHIEVISWFTFLLRELARPYQRSLYETRISGIHWVAGKTKSWAKASQIRAYYFASSDDILSDRLAEFVCACDKASGGKILERLKQRFDRIYIDEIQDMAGYDLELLEAMMKTGVNLTLVGDHRQPTFRTNYSGKNSGYAGYAIIKKFREWEKSKLCSLDYRRVSYRCNQEITDFADALYPAEPTTTSQNRMRTGHDGVFHIPASAVADYVLKYQPQVLRYDKRSPCDGHDAMNFGISKGLTFERVLIFPTKKMAAWLISGNDAHIEGSRAKTYVAMTRARYSVAFVLEKVPTLAGMTAWTP